MLIPELISLYDPLKAEFVFIALAIRRSGALLKLFSWMNRFCPAGMIKIYARDSN